jgi:RNA polymerase sigma-32 factor
MCIQQIISCTSHGNSALERGEERELIRRWQHERDASARAILVKKFQPLVAKIARTCRGAGLEQADKVSLGNLGLLRALEKFDLGRETRFATFAQFWIRAFILKEARKTFSIVARPRGVFAEVDLSLNTEINGEDSDDLQNQLRDEEPCDAVEAVCIDIAGLHQALSALNQRERTILAARRLMDPPTTLPKLAKKFAISSERVRQIEVKAYDKITAVLKKAEGMPSPVFARAMTLSTFAEHRGSLSQSQFRHPYFRDRKPGGARHA